MMRAFAVLAAAAVVLFALPTTAGASGEEGPLRDVAADASDRAASFLDKTAVFGLTMGVVLWLSVAVLGLTFAMVALSRSRDRAQVSADSVPAGQVFSWSEDVATAG